MITKTLNLEGAYTELFNNIREDSDGAIDINNIEGFFGNILEISALDKKYLRLPLDEPLFEIDANSRKITIPDQFKTNGLSVQGDHLAETVYFVIDRYFDYMDLNNTDVTINWKMGQEVGKTNKFTMNTSIQPGAIVFGWPVDNIVTQKSGTLTFAVEFCRKNDQGEILYDFNTLSASITIKEGLIIGDVEVVSLDNDILAALTNSQFGEGDAAVGDIQWLTGDGHGLIKVLGPEGSGTLQSYESEINLATNVVAGVPQSVPANLVAQAFVDSGTEVKYMDAVGNDITPVFNLVVTNLIKIEDRDNLNPDKIYYDKNGPGQSRVAAEDLEDAEELWSLAPIDENLIYYVKLEDSDPIAYRQATAEEVSSYNTDNAVNLYIKLAKIQANKAGTYIIKAQGVKFDNEGHKIGAGVTENTDTITVPSVSAPETIIIEKSSNPEVEDGYSFDEENSEKVLFISDEEIGTLKVKVDEDENGAFQFIWQKKLPEDNEFSNMTEEDIPYITKDRFHSVIEDTLSVEDEGEYKVLVTKFLNGEYSAQLASDIYTASKLAGKITEAKVQYHLGANEFINVEGPIRYNSAGSIAQKSVTLGIKDVVVDGQIGELSYEWYKEDGIGEDITITLVSTAEEFLVTSGDGNYIPVVKNNYNGSIYTYTLSSVSIDDIA